MKQGEKDFWIYRLAFFAILAGIVCWVEGNWVMARDLNSAARVYTNTIKSIGQGMSVAGVVAGGICMQIPGVAQFGKGVLAGGLVGGLCSFGAPAFVSLLTTVFGTG